MEETPSNNNLQNIKTRLGRDNVYLFPPYLSPCFTHTTPHPPSPQPLMLRTKTNGQLPIKGTPSENKITKRSFDKRNQSQSHHRPPPAMWPRRHRLRACDWPTKAISQFKGQKHCQNKKQKSQRECIYSLKRHMCTYTNVDKNTNKIQKAIFVLWEPKGSLATPASWSVL